MKTKLGQMRPDYCCPASVSEKDGDKTVESFPTVYISNKDLPNLKIGQEVTIKGIVTSYGERKNKTSKDGESSVEELCDAEIECKTLITSGQEEKSSGPKDDMDEIEKGLTDTEDKKDEEDPYEEKD